MKAMYGGPFTGSLKAMYNNPIGGSFAPLIKKKSGGKPPTIIKDGLMLHLDGGDKKSYPGTGTTWFDLSGNGRNATINGSPNFENGYFDITSDSTYMSLSNDGLVPRTNDFTYSCWINFDAIDTLDTIFENGSWTDTLLFRYQTNLINVYAEGALGGTFNWVASTEFWYNIVFKRENGICTLYINGIQIGSSFTMTTDINLQNSNLFLMRSQYQTGQFINGKIATFSIYNKALTELEINYNYNLLKSRFEVPIITDGLALYLDSTDINSYPGTGTTWFDLSGNNRHFVWDSVNYSSGSIPHFLTLNKQCLGPASNSFGIDNTSGYTIFLIMYQITLTNSSAFNFYGSGPYDRGIFSHCVYSDGNIYFDQGGCCNSDTRLSVSSGGSQNWNIFTFRRFTNSSTRTISKNGTTLATTTSSAANINLDSRSVEISRSTNWDARLGGFIAYNRGLSDIEIKQVVNSIRSKFGI